MAVGAGQGGRQVLAGGVGGGGVLPAATVKSTPTVLPSAVGTRQSGLERITLPPRFAGKISRSS